MNAYELLARNGEHVEGVVVPQVILRSERKSGEIGELTEVRRMHTTRVEGTPIMRDVVIGMLERPGKPPGLQRDDLITRRAFGLVHLGLIAAGPGLQCGRSHGTCPPAFCSCRCDGLPRTAYSGPSPAGTSAPPMLREWPRNSAITVSSTLTRTS